MFRLCLNGNLHKKRMLRHEQAIRTSDPAVLWEEDDTGLRKRLAIEPRFSSSLSKCTSRNTPFH